MFETWSKYVHKKIHEFQGSLSGELRGVSIYVVTVHKLLYLLRFHWGTPILQFFSCELDLDQISIIYQNEGFISTPCVYFRGDHHFPTFHNPMQLRLAQILNQTKFISKNGLYCLCKFFQGTFWHWFSFRNHNTMHLFSISFHWIVR